MKYLLVSGMILVLGCSAADMTGEEGPVREGSIVITSPTDGQPLVATDDEDEIAAGLQITVRATVTGIHADENVRLHLRDDTYDVHWDHFAAHDGSGEVSFEGVTLWGGLAEEETGHYTMQVFSSDDAFWSSTVTVTANSAVTDYAAPGTWELECSSCTDDSACDNGLACDGREFCAFSQYRGAFCCYTETLDCTVSDECITGFCSEETGGCVTAPRDDDDDGHPPASCGYDDCNDDDYSIHPGAQELCDDLDNDCDGAIDENAWIATGASIALSDPTDEPTSPVMVEGPSSVGVAWLGSSDTLQLGIVIPGASPVVNVTESSPGASVDDIAMTWTSAGFSIVASVHNLDGSTTIYGHLVASDGTITGAWTEILTFPSLVQDLAIASFSDTIGLVFRSDPGGDYELYLLDITLPVVAPYAHTDVTRITDAIGFSGHPSLIATSSGFALAWEDGRDGNTEIYFTLLDSSGSPTITHRRVTTAPGSSEGVSVAVSSDGGFALAWMDSRDGGYDLLFTCLDEDATRVCPEIAIGDDDLAWYPSLITDGHPGQFALAYAGATGTYFEASLSAVSTGDAISDPIEPGVSLSDEASSIYDLAIADTAGYRMVSWIESSSGVTSLRLSQLACDDGS